MFEGEQPHMRASSVVPPTRLTISLIAGPCDNTALPVIIEPLSALNDACKVLL
jgi:hypothetical protein